MSKPLLINEYLDRLRDQLAVMRARVEELERRLDQQPAQRTK